MKKNTYFQVWSQILFLLQVVVLSLLIQNLAFYFIDPNVKPSVLLKSLYASFHRPIFSFSMCSVVLLFTIGDGLGNFFLFQILSTRKLCISKGNIFF